MDINTTISQSLITHMYAIKPRKTIVNLDGKP